MKEIVDIKLKENKTEERRRISIDEWLSPLSRIGRPSNSSVVLATPTVQNEKDAYKIIYERTAEYCKRIRGDVLTYYDVMIAIKGLGLEANNLLKSSNPTEVEYAQKTLTFLEDFINAFDGRISLYHRDDGTILFLYCNLDVSNWHMFNKGAKIIFKAFDLRFRARYEKEMLEKREQGNKKLAEQKKHERALKDAIKKKNKTFIDKYKNK